MQYSLWTLQFWGIEAQIPFTRLITTVQKRPGVPLPGSSVDKHSCNRKGWKPLKHLEAVGSVAGLGSSFLWVPVPQLSYRARNYLYLHLSDQLSHHEKRRFFWHGTRKGHSYLQRGCDDLWVSGVPGEYLGYNRDTPDYMRNSMAFTKRAPASICVLKRK